MKISEIINENVSSNLPDDRIMEDMSAGTLVDRNKIIALFGKDQLEQLERTNGTAVVFDRDMHGRNWKLIKTSDGKIYIERDYMLEGDSVIFESNGKALVGIVSNITEDTLTIEGGVFPLDDQEHDYSELEPETDLSTMPHKAQILGISSEIYYLMHQKDDEISADADEDDLVDHDKETEDKLNHWDNEAKKLGYVPAMDLAEYPFTDIHWYHVPTHRLFTIDEKHLRHDQSFRGTVNEKDTLDVEPKRSRKDNRLWLMITDYEERARKTKNDIKRNHYMRMASDLRDKLTVNETVNNFTIDDIKHLETLNGLNDVKRQAISLVTTPSKRPISPEKQAWLKNEIIGKKDKMAVIKLMYDLMLGGEGMKVIGSKSGYRRRFDEKELSDRRSFTVKMEFEDGGKVTRVFLAKDKQEALSKAMKWAKNEYDPEQGVEAKIVAEGLSQSDIMVDPLGSDMDRKELLGLIHAEIDRLKEPRRSVVKLWADGKTQREISDELGISAGHVGFVLRSTLHKLKHRVRSKPGYSHMNEAEYHGRKVQLGKPMAGDVKKYKVYVKDPKTGNVKKVNFGDKGMEIKRDNPERRKNFRARHGCGTPRASDRTKAAYWSCRMWSKKPVSKILKGK